MNRDSLFAFRVNDQERAIIAKLASYLKRSRSDAIRLLILEAAEQLEQRETGDDSDDQAG